MEPIRRNDSGAAVLDVQRRLAAAGFLAEEAITGTFDAKTANAVAQLCVACGIDPRQAGMPRVYDRRVGLVFAGQLSGNDSGASARRGRRAGNDQTGRQ